MPYGAFYSSVLPGNYALTKSMELTKETTSGTLWYTKKFLVLYYYVFLSNDLTTREYIRKVTGAYDSFILSLDPDIREEATRFFYPENDIINFKSERFKLFGNFAPGADLEDLLEREKYFQSAKKMYFALLIGSGGQSGVKKALKEAIEREDFVYSKAAIDNAIMDAVKNVCVEQIGRDGNLTDRSVPRIISSDAINELKETARTGTPLTREVVGQIISRYNDHPLDLRGIENDMVGFIRNERQVLYYYGYFHSRSLGLTDEFSSLTPVGEMALGANSQEFLAVWEHQKIKMISQPATADVTNVVECCNAPDRFAISYTPYTDILGHLARNNALSLEQYKYIVSRRSHNISENDWISHEADILSHLDELKALVEGFGRVRDKKDDDGRKELLKYGLGIRSDLRLDSNTHSLGVIQKRQGAFITDTQRTEELYRIYFGLETYKVARYGELFEECENDLKRRYNNALGNEDTSVDPRVKINWDLYNIRLDKFILFGVAIAETAFHLGLDLLSGNTRGMVGRILSSLNERYTALLRAIGYRTNRAKRARIGKTLEAIRNNDYSEFVRENTEDRVQITAEYREIGANDLLARIRNVSGRAIGTQNGERIRNTSLVSLLKSYYMARFTENGTLKCECCSQEAFISKSGEPYVEFHHLIPFNGANGPDHYLNLFALCPNCHRKLHYIRFEEKQRLYSSLNTNNYFQINFVQRLRELKEQMILMSYHLEYLLAENAITDEEYETVVA